MVTNDTATEEEVCVHYEKLSTPAGKYSYGLCLKCGQWKRYLTASEIWGAKDNIYPLSLSAYKEDFQWINWRKEEYYV
jgi:hypothetical protein